MSKETKLRREGGESLKKRLEAILKSCEYVYVYLDQIPLNRIIQVSMFSMGTKYPMTIKVPKLVAENLNLRIITEEQLKEDWPTFFIKANP